MADPAPAAGGREVLDLLASPGRVRSAAAGAIAAELHMTTGTCRDRAHSLSGRLLDAAVRGALGALELQPPPTKPRPITPDPGTRQT